MHIIAYTYEADVHCPDCAARRFAHNPYTSGHLVDFNGNPTGKSFRKPGVFTSYKDGVETALDEHLIPINAIDREGNPIHPVFDIDEDLDGSFTHCGDCHEALS